MTHTGVRQENGAARTQRKHKGKSKRRLRWQQKTICYLIYLFPYLFIFYLLAHVAL